MMDAFDDRLDEAARALADRLPAIDASLDDRVMQAIQSRPVVRSPARPAGILRLLTEPRAIRVRPVWGLALAAALAAILLVPRRAAVTGRPADVATAAADTIYVHFSLSAPQARAVSVAGSFNGWDAASLPLRRAADGSWEATVPLPVGEHRYEFVVDGQRWIPDPRAQSQADDGFGGTNSVIVVGPKGVVRS